MPDRHWKTTHIKEIEMPTHLPETCQLGVVSRLLGVKSSIPQVVALWLRQSFHLSKHGFPHLIASMWFAECGKITHV